MRPGVRCAAAGGFVVFARLAGLAMMDGSGGQEAGQRSPAGTVLLLTDVGVSWYGPAEGEAVGRVWRELLSFTASAKAHQVPVLAVSDAAGQQHPLFAKIWAIADDGFLVAPGRVDVWRHARLVETLGRWLRPRLVIGGGMLEGAVAFAAINGLAAGYDAHILVDCCIARSQRECQATLTRLGQAGAVLTTKSAVYREWDAARA